MYFCDSKRRTLLLKGENSPFRKIVSLLKLIFDEIYFNMVQEIRGGQIFGNKLICNVFVT